VEQFAAFMEQQWREHPANIDSWHLRRWLYSSEVSEKAPPNSAFGDSIK
jgi:hypothetical protein